jgi:hypothetical protein
MPEGLGVQEYAAMANARTLLQRLSDPRLTPRIPREIRREAMALLRWFPKRDRLIDILQDEEDLAAERVSPGVSGSWMPANPGAGKGLGC